MRVTMIQLDFDAAELFEDRVGRVVGLVHARRGSDLVVLPELWPNGGFTYSMWEETAERLDGPIVSSLAGAARDIEAYVHLGSFVERHVDGTLTNTAVLLDPQGGVAAVYRKMHLFGFSDGEPKLMTAGTEVVVADTAFGRVGLATCYDLRFPELFRALRDLDADVVVVPAAWPMARVDHWRLLAQARAVENQYVVVAVNTVGEQGGKAMGGYSAVIDARGALLAEASADAEQVIDVEVDLADVAVWREAFPVNADRRL